LKDSLFENLKSDYLKAYKWYAEKQGKPGVRVWKKGKDDRSLALLIQYMKAYYLQLDGSKLNTEQMHKACRIWLHKAFSTAPEWLSKDGSLNVLVSRFELIMEAPDPNSEAHRITQLQKQKRAGLKYDPHKHEVIPPLKVGEASMLSSIIKSIAEKSE